MSHDFGGKQEGLSGESMSRSKKSPVCVYCGSNVNLTRDHVVPRSRGSEFKLKRRQLNNASNLVTCCYRCNQAKGDRSPEEWFDEHPEFREHFEHHAKFLSNRVKVLCGML